MTDDYIFDGDGNVLWDDMYLEFEEIDEEMNEDHCDQCGGKLSNKNSKVYQLILQPQTSMKMYGKIPEQYFIDRKLCKTCAKRLFDYLGGNNARI